MDENDEDEGASSESRLAAWARYLDGHIISKADLKDYCVANCHDYDKKTHKTKVQLLELAKTALPPSSDHPFYHELKSD